MIAHGRVQGVFYRDTMRRAALEHGVHGSAVNLPDGTVECHFEGPRSAVEAMVEVARTGPPRGNVTRLDVEWQTPQGLTDFRTG